MTLNAQGAALFRQAREHILNDPSSFYMGLWDCGSTCCIGGWMCRIADIGEVHSDNELSIYCGFGPIKLCVLPTQHPMHNLFYRYCIADAHDPLVAAKKINEFLWAYGYPADEIRRCSCHSGSVCNSACEVGKCHDGCEGVVNEREVTR